MQRDGEPLIDRAEAERLVASGIHGGTIDSRSIRGCSHQAFTTFGVLADLKLPANFTGKTILDQGPALLRTPATTRN